MDVWWCLEKKHISHTYDVCCYWRHKYDFLVVLHVFAPNDSCCLVCKRSERGTVNSNIMQSQMRAKFLRFSWKKSKKKKQFFCCVVCAVRIIKKLIFVKKKSFIDVNNPTRKIYFYYYVFLMRRIFQIMRC